ncbi:MAG: hypothetical protein ACXVLX_17950 [Ilumatobacteraceae bacterium]
MPTFHPQLHVWFRKHHGVVSRSQLVALGITRHALAAMISCGELTVVWEGVYRHALWPDTFLSRCGAICATDPSLVVTCGGAARTWGYRRCAHLDIHVSGTGTGLRFAGGPVHHRCPVMPSDHVICRSDGIRVTSPARTIFDLAKHLRREDLESVIEQGLRLSLVDIPALYAVGSLLCRRGRPGSALFAAVLSSRPTWRRPADSHPEVELRTALSAVGVHLEPQVSLTLRDGQTVHPDLGDPTVGFYIEIDDHEWHSGRLDATYDMQRDRKARLVGARIERVSTDEIRAMPPSLVSSLVAAYRQQRTLSLSTR